MRSVSLSLFGVVAVATLAPAQNNEFEIYPHPTIYATTYVTRVAGGGECEMCQEIPGALFAGIGENGVSCEVWGFRGWFVDENPSTPESYQFVLRNNDPVLGGPLPSPGGEIARLPSATTFYMTAPGGTTRSTYIEAQSFATPVAVPCTGGFSMGVALQAGTWSTDGMAPWVAYYYPPGGTSPATGDNPRPGAPNHGYELTAFGSVVAPTTNPMTIRYRVFVRSANLNIGGIDPGWVSSPGTSCYGAGGMYPQVDGMPRSDGIDIRIQDLPNAGGQMAVFWGTGINPFGRLPIFTFGNLYLDPSTIIGTWGTNGAVLDGGGNGVALFLPPGSVPVSVALRARIAFQGISVGPNFQNGRLTNLQITSL